MSIESELGFNIEVTYGAQPDFSSSDLDSQLIFDGWGYQPAATAFITGADGRDYAYVFPTLFRQDPQLPGLEYVRRNDGGFQFSQFLNDVSLGNGRDFSVISDASSGVASFAIVDHGLEYTTGYEDWPFGHVWVARDSGVGFVFDQVSDVKAFYHAVDTGDINGDGLVDIVASHMGVKEGGQNIDLHAFLQQSDGEFIQDLDFARSIEGSGGTGAVAIASVDQSPSSEIIQVNYRSFEGDEGWGGIRVLSLDGAGEYQISTVIPREGLFDLMGATRVRPFDYDQDGDLDLALSFEGRYSVSGSDGSGNGLEIYNNDGEGNFRRATDDLMSQNQWLMAELQFREFEIVDVDRDGFQDIILNGWAGTESSSGEGWNLGWNLASLIFRNVGGERFVQLSDTYTEGLNLPVSYYESCYIRVVDTFDTEKFELFIIQVDGTPVTVRLDPLYRDDNEILTVGGIGTLVNGFGGNDLFEVTGKGVSIDGGEDTDTAYFSDSLNKYRIEVANDKVSIFDQTEGTLPSSLTNIERLQFTDTSVALDIEDPNSAGGIYRTYQAAFARTPDKGGFGYWLSRADEGLSAVEIAEGFTWSEEFMDVYGVDTPSHYLEGSDIESVVDGFYRNVLGRDPDQGGLNYYSGVIETHEKTVGRVLAEIADSPENRENLLPAIQNGMEYDLWLG